MISKHGRWLMNTHSGQVDNFTGDEYRLTLGLNLFLNLLDLVYFRQTLLPDSIQLLLMENKTSSTLTDEWTYL